MGVVQLAESQGATHARTTGTGPHRLDAPRHSGRPRRRIEHQPGVPPGRHHTDHLLPLEGPPGGPRIEGTTPRIRTRSRGRPPQAPGRRAGARPPHAPGGLEKKATTAARRRSIVTEVSEHINVSQRRASRALDLPRSSLRYTPVARDERAALARRIEELAGTPPRFGSRRIWA